MVKVLSAVLVHIFFVVVVILIYLFMGYPPTWYTLQLFYYSLCLFILVLALTYLTSSVVVFFRDLSQIIAIALQVGIWATPIMWAFEDLGLGGTIVKIFQLNPVYYVVQGFRDCLITHVGFWEHPILTLYYWAFTLIVFFLGTKLFRKLQIHFADIL